MQSTHLGFASGRLVWPLIFLAVVGTSLGYYFGHALAPQRELAQPIIDALSKPIPAPPIGKLLQHSSIGSGYQGPDKNGHISVRYGESLVIDITDAPNNDAVEKIVRFYADYYASATGTSWGSSSGNPTTGLQRSSDGTFYEGGKGNQSCWYVVKGSANRDLRMDIAVLDFAEKAVRPLDVESLMGPPNGRRVMWLRCQVAAHNLYGPVKLP